MWSTRVELEEGLSIQSETEVDQADLTTESAKATVQASTDGQTTTGIWEALRNGNKQTTQDRLYLNSIYIYELLPWIGPYVRARGETQLTERVTNFSFDDTDVIAVTIQNEAEEEVAVLYLNENRRLAKPWSPLKFKQGAGVNFRLAHTTFLDLDLRTGLGLTQYLPRLGENVPTDNPVVLTMTAPRNVFGPESTVLASARFTRSLRATTVFDLFIPAQGLIFSSLTWRSSISLQLGRFATLIYALNLERNREVFVDDPEDIAEGFELPVATEHNLQLRFWFTPIEL